MRIQTSSNCFCPDINFTKLILKRGRWLQSTKVAKSPIHNENFHSSMQCWFKAKNAILLHCDFHLASATIATVETADAKVTKKPSRSSPILSSTPSPSKIKITKKRFRALKVLSPLLLHFLIFSQFSSQLVQTGKLMKKAVVCKILHVQGEKSSD